MTDETKSESAAPTPTATQTTVVGADPAVAPPTPTATQTTVVGADPAVAPPAQPPVDNEHVAAGAEQFATAAPKPVLIKPTVGRVVWYWPNVKAVNDGEQPRAAILTYVQDDHTVNLVSFGHDGFPLPHHGIRLLEVDEPAPASGHFACWMPF